METPVRMLLVGEEGSEFRLATEMARDNGALVAIVGSVDEAIDRLRAVGGDLVLIDVGLDVRRLVERLRARKITASVLACGIDAPASAAVSAIHAGARDYVPLPPEREIIAAVIASMASRVAQPIEVNALIGNTVADVERALILDTLAHCQGNRTTAATILGISVRTMRNKLRSFIEAGVPVSPAAH